MGDKQVITVLGATPETMARFDKALSAGEAQTLFNDVRLRLATALEIGECALLVKQYPDHLYICAAQGRHLMRDVRPALEVLAKASNLSVIRAKTSTPAMHRFYQMCPDIHCIADNGIEKTWELHVNG